VLTLTQVALLDVSAASGLVALPQALCVVADDELFLAIYDFAGRPLGRVALWPGELPQAHAERKRRKPDLEALTLLPDGQLLALASGSTRGRERGALIDVSKIGELREIHELPVRSVDLSALYAGLRARVPELNIEGAAATGARLWLAQRGNGASHFNACIELDLARACVQLSTGAALDERVICAIHPLQLGELQGVPLSVTDLAAHPRGGLLFTAAAEDSDDTYADGSCKGSVLGVLGADAQLRALVPVQPTCKLEGVTVAEGKLWLVSDPDDRALRAQLFETELPG
jgi:hypothetical protein